jgi:hypothetical protein
VVIVSAFLIFGLIRHMEPTGDGFPLPQHTIDLFGMLTYELDYPLVKTHILPIPAAA